MIIMMSYRMGEGSVKQINAASIYAIVLSEKIEYLRNFFSKYMDVCAQWVGAWDGGDVCDISYFLIARARYFQIVFFCFVHCTIFL